MSQTIVTYTVKPGREDDNAALVRAVFKELAETRPTGFRYAVFQASDSGEFLHLYIDEGSTSGTLQRLPAFQAFAAEAENRHQHPAVFKRFEVVGAYRTFDDPEKPATTGALAPQKVRLA